jgi:hypothetical protein
LRTGLALVLVFQIDHILTTVHTLNPLSLFLRQKWVVSYLYSQRVARVISLFTILAIRDEFLTCLAFVAAKHICEFFALTSLRTQVKIPSILCSAFGAFPLLIQGSYLVVTFIAFIFARTCYTMGYRIFTRQTFSILKSRPLLAFHTPEWRDSAAFKTESESIALLAHSVV